jgi:hypothetical protein
MKPSRIVLVSMIAAALGLNLGLTGEFGISSARAESVRPEIGAPLKEAQSLLKARKFNEALGKLRDADAVGGKTAYESYVLEQMRISAANGAGDPDLAAKSLTNLVATGRLSANDRGSYTNAVMGAYLRTKEYKKAIVFGQEALRNGVSSSDLRSGVIQAQYMSGDISGAIRELNADISASERAGKAPSENSLNLLANCYLRNKDNVGYDRTLERLLSLYPKRETWASVISSLQKKSGLADRYGLHLYRLQMATGNLAGSDAYMEMGQLALQGGSAAEAKKIVEEGFDKKALGTGPDADRHKRLRELAARKAAEESKEIAKGESAAKDPDSMVNLGFGMVVNGQSAQGLALMEKGITAGNLKRPEEAKLRLGYAYLKSGDKAKAAKAFKSVQGTDGASNIARLWVLFSGRG